MTRGAILGLALAIAGCRGGPLRDVEAGERRGGREEVDAKRTIAKGSARDLACEVRWADAPLRTKLEASWWFTPAAGGARAQLGGAERFTRETSGKWFVFVSTKTGWDAGTYTCEFVVGAQRRAGSIVAK